MTTIWIIILLVLLVIIVAIGIAVLISKSVAGTFEFPAPPELLSPEEKAFIDRPELVGKLCAFISKNQSKIFIDMLPDTKVTKEVVVTNHNIAFHDFCCDEIGKIYDDFESEMDSLIIRHQNDELSDDHVQDFREIYEENKQRRIKRINKLKLKNVSDTIKKLDKINSGIVVIPLGFINGDSAHATCLIIDYENKRFITIDPHVLPKSYYAQMMWKIVDDIMITLERVRNFKSVDLASEASKYKCPIFQGSFDEKFGLCTIWQLYITFLFVKNKESKYQEMLNAHARNAKWTQRRLQNFAFTLYKKYQREIDAVAIFNESPITGEVYPKSKGY